MNTNKKGFTLIELLVVIVIIGILATISVATFSGYFKKARDAERKAAINSIATVMKVQQTVEESPNYELSGKSGTDGTPAGAKYLDNALAKQGYTAPNSKQSRKYIYAYGGTNNSEFVVAVCSEDEFEADGTTPKKYTAGTPAGVATVTCNATGVASSTYDADQQFDW